MSCTRDNARLNGYIDPAVDRYRALGQEEGGAELQRAFRRKLSSYCNFYGFLAQIIPFHDPDLEKLYAFGRMLLLSLPQPAGGRVKVDDEVLLRSIKLRHDHTEDIELAPGDTGELPAPSGGEGAEDDPAREKLSTIIEIINDKFGTEFDAQDLVDGVSAQLRADEALKQAAVVNDRDNFAHVFAKALDDALLARHDRHGAFIDRVFDDEELRGFFRAVMLDQLYDALRSDSAANK